jgi:hypothetical protein
MIRPLFWAAAFCAPFAAFGQAAPATPTPCALPQEWAAAGAAWNQYARPEVNAWASYSHLISCSGQIYSYTTEDFMSARGRMQQSIRTGFAAVLRCVGPLCLLVLGDAGLATGTASGATTIGGAMSYGGIGILRLGSTLWTLAVAVRPVRSTVAQPGDKTQTLFEFGIGRRSQ